jgi:hypothetical protein
MFIYWFVPFIVAAVAIMLSSELFDHDFSALESTVMAFFATILPFVFRSFLYSQLSFIYVLPFGDMILSFVSWIVLSLIIMHEADWEDKIKIAVLGFVITQIVLFILPYLGVIY